MIDVAQDEFGPWWRVYLDLREVYASDGLDSVIGWLRMNFPESELHSVNLWVYPGAMEKRFPPSVPMQRVLITTGQPAVTLTDDERRTVIELCEASSNMRNAANRLWWAHNLEEDYPEDDGPPTEEVAQEAHSAAFKRLERAEYYVRKRLGTLLAPVTANPTTVAACAECNGNGYLHNGTTRVGCDQCEGRGK